MIPLAAGVKAYLIYFFCSVVNWKLFLCESCEKISLFRPDFMDSEIVIWGLTSLTDFYKRVHLLLNKHHASDCQKKISFVQIIPPKLTFLSRDNIKSYY